MADQSCDKTLDSSDQPQSEPELTRSGSSSRLNAQAPEFVPKKTQPPPPARVDPRVMIAPQPPAPPPLMHVYAASPPNPAFPVPIAVQNHHVSPVHHHHHQHQQQQQQQQYRVHHHHQKHHQFHVGGDQEGAGQGDQDKDHGNGGPRNGLSEEAIHKIINQVEYYFSDINLATTDHLIRFINKDPEGYVPTSVVASFKKIKALVSSNSQLAAVLRNSTKLVVSEDGKKVKRLHPLTGSDMEDLQCRIIVAENLPEDHCHQNLMKVFSAVGSVKSIRTCQPQNSNGGSSASRSSKSDNMLYSNKLHAFVEYESIELAEKAVTELNDEGDWRSGLRVRLLAKRTTKTAQGRGEKFGNEGDGTCEKEDGSTSDLHQNEKQSDDPIGQTDAHEHVHGDEQGVEKDGAHKKGRNRSRGKGRGRGQHLHGNRANHIGAPPTSAPTNDELPTIAKQPPPGPRMPDGTRGFSMGRGRPVPVNTAA